MSGESLVSVHDLSTEIVDNKYAPDAQVATLVSEPLYRGVSAPILGTTAAVNTPESRSNPIRASDSWLKCLSITTIRLKSPTPQSVYA